MDTPGVICIILSRVPGLLQDRWNRNVHKIRKNQTREPGLVDLTNFVEDEINVVSDPLFSREAVRQYEDNYSNLINQRKYRVMVSRRHQGTRIEKLQSAQYVKVSMILRSAKLR